MPSVSTCFIADVMLKPVLITILRSKYDLPCPSVFYINEVVRKAVPNKDVHLWHKAVFLGCKHHMSDFTSLVQPKEELLRETAVATAFPPDYRTIEKFSLRLVARCEILC